MPDDLDHEVIDSPQALFRHLYEAHGVVEALDLDPATAPLQFWLRRHAELESAATRVATRDRETAAPLARARDLVGASSAGGPGSPSAPPESLGTAERRSPDSTWRSSTLPPATPRPAGRGSGGAAATRPAGPGGAAGNGPGPRFRPFADPMVEALAAALVRRGLDERRVRRGLSTFTGTDGRHGEDAVRAAFVSPMLEAVAAQLAGDPPDRAHLPPLPRAAAPRDPDARGRVGATQAREPAPLLEPARATGPESDADVMAIADVLQQRRRSRRGGRRDATAPPVPASTAPPPASSAPNTPAGGPPVTRRQPTRTPPAREPDDDVMALANAVQRRRRSPH